MCLSGSLYPVRLELLCLPARNHCSGIPISASSVESSLGVGLQETVIIQQGFQEAVSQEELTLHYITLQNLQAQFLPGEGTLLKEAMDKLKKRLPQLRDPSQQQQNATMLDTLIQMMQSDYLRGVLHSTTTLSAALAAVKERAKQQEAAKVRNCLCALPTRHACHVRG